MKEQRFESCWSWMFGVVSLYCFSSPSPSPSPPVFINLLSTLFLTVLTIVLARKIRLHTCPEFTAVSVSFIHCATTRVWIRCAALCTAGEVSTRWGQAALQENRFKVIFIAKGTTCSDFKGKGGKGEGGGGIWAFWSSFLLYGPGDSFNTRFYSAFTRANERVQTRKQSEPIGTLTRNEDANKNERKTR